MVGCDVARGVALKALSSNCFAAPLHAPQHRLPQLRKIKQIASPKNLHGGLRGEPPHHSLRNSASAASAKSIAPCRMQLQKKLHGGLRGATLACA